MWGSVPVSTPQMLCLDRKAAISILAMRINEMSGLGRYSIYLLKHTVNIPNISLLI